MALPPGVLEPSGEASKVSSLDPRSDAPLLAIQYRLTHRDGKPLPFAAWFEGAPGGRIHAVDVTFQGTRGQATYVASAPPHELHALERRVLEVPATNCDVWSLRRRERGILGIHGAWNEPVYPGVHSPMWIAKGVMPDAAVSLTITPDAVRHRVLAPALEPANAMWRRLLDEMTKYAGFAQVDVVCALEKLAPITFPKDPTRERAARSAFAFGVTDGGPTWALADAAAHLGTDPDVLAKRIRSE